MWPVLEPGTKYVHGWHIDVICAHLEAVTFGTFRAMGLRDRLLINVPPGTMKSYLVSVFWPAWEWAMGYEYFRYVTTSYREDFTVRDTRRMRDLILSEHYQALFGDRVRLTRTGETSFENTAHGNRECYPFKSLTGGRGDRLIIDDPHSTETAESDADRETATRIFRESVPLRVNDAQTSAIVMIMQRLHENDLSGVAIGLGGWIILFLPMEFDPSRRCTTPIFRDPRTEEGELLFPQRFPRATLDIDKATMGDYAVAGQLQQSPVARGGNLFKRHWFGRVRIDALPARRKKVRSWDFASTKAGVGAGKKKSTKPNWTRGVKVSRSVDGIFYVEGVVGLREDAAEIRRLVKNTAADDGREVRITLPQDPGQAGKDQAEQYLKVLAGYVVNAKPVSGSKEVRADAAASQAKGGNVLLVATGDPIKDAWIEPFIDELAAFPRGDFDDQVDAFADAVNFLSQVSSYTLDNL